MSQPGSDVVDRSARADEAARSVTRRFGRTLLLLPGTHLAATSWPLDHALSMARPWHYWWQAHYLDCLVDTAGRELQRGAMPAARFDGADNAGAAQLASRLFTGILLRNGFTVVNDYFDDMAWLALAAMRLEALSAAAGKRPRRRYAAARHRLEAQFISASTDDLGGGTFWSKARDFKNTPATAPVALYFARTGQQKRAQGLVDWLNKVLFDAERCLYLDGARPGAQGQILVEGNVYTYNQGPILGALLELGGPRNLQRAAEVIAGVERHLTLPDATGAVLRCDGTGDRGLFTGILCRYLALAALDTRLPDSARRTAERLVLGTADAFWAGSVAGTLPQARIFALHANATAMEDYPPGAAVELSSQLQAWLTLEAAATLTPLSGK